MHKILVLKVILLNFEFNSLGCGEILFDLNFVTKYGKINIGFLS